VKSREPNGYYEINPLPDYEFILFRITSVAC
jgi:hypothetical protein